MKLVVCCLVMFSMVFVCNAPAKIDKKAVVGMWLFEEGGGNIAEDVSGNGNNGNIAGPKKWTQGKFGKGLQFDGSSVWVEVPFADNLVLEELTISSSQF